MRPGSNPGPPRATSRPYARAPGRVANWVSGDCFSLYKLHVYSSMWSEAEALSEYGVVPEELFF
jgi:hypothetical protein